MLGFSSSNGTSTLSFTRVGLSSSTSVFTSASLLVSPALVPSTACRLDATGNAGTQIITHGNRRGYGGLSYRPRGARAARREPRGPAGRQPGAGPQGGTRCTRPVKHETGDARRRGPARRREPADWAAPGRGTGGGRSRAWCRGRRGNGGAA